VTIRDLLEAEKRRLTALYDANGHAALCDMSGAEMMLLLSAKMFDLEAASVRALGGQGRHVNVPLKDRLEGDIRVIREQVQGRGHQRGGMER
jgi:hypothetical protein